MLIKKIKIPKGKLLYFFIGGMVYNEKFSFDTGSKNQYPFTTYYVSKIMDKTEDDIRYKSLIYCKLPLICLQFEDYCKCIEFDLPAKCGGEEITPFVGLRETEDFYEIIFRHFPQIVLKEKRNAWLGFAKKKKINLPEGDIVFKVRQYNKKTWKEAVSDFFEKQKIRPEKIHTDELIPKVKSVLFRSFDNEFGTFLQLPWANSTGFCMDKYSYSFPGFDAKRLNYFQELYEKTGDPDYKYWVNRLERLFLNPNLHKNTKNGFVWCNNTHFDGVKLKGLFYLNVGYAGYPPGQATISLNLAEYLQRKENKKLMKLLKNNLDYILRTQNDGGSWPSAIAYEFQWREWRNSEGSTAECVRALLKGYCIFKDKRYRKAAEKALEYLDRENIICRNVLRDIGIDEPEAFSAIIAVEAFLDASEILKDKKYLQMAKYYAYYILTWVYWYGNLKGYFHPISESITPRISPFESLMIVKVYKRLYNKTKEKFWDRISDYLFKGVMEIKNKDNSISEGVFPTFDGSIYYLPSEQTFATAELLHTCFIYGSHKYKEPKKENIKVEDKEDYLLIEDFIKINKEKYGIKINENNFDIIISGPYKIKSRLYTEISKGLRKFGFLNAARDAIYLLRGLHQPFDNKTSKEIIDKHVNSFSIDKGDKEILIRLELDFHEIKMVIYKSGKIKMDLFIRVKEHDLICKKVIINDTNYTLDTNWTNGGLFKKTIDL